MKLSEFTDDKKEILSSVTEVIKDKVVNVITTSINEDITFEKVEEGMLDKTMIHGSLGAAYVYVSAYFKDGFKGEVGFMLMKSTVAQIADKMLMGEGDAEFDEMEHLDAIKEVLNQILGAASTEFTGIFEFPVTFAEAQARLISFKDMEALISEDDLLSHYSISILDKSDVFIYFPAATFDSILKKLSNLQKDTVASVRTDEALEQTTIGSNMIGEVSSGRDLGLLMDVRLPVSVELGRKKMFIRDILKLTPGEVVELPKLQGEPVDLFVNDKKFATGEVVVIAENFGIRIKSLIKPQERLRESDAWMNEKEK